MHGKPKDKKPIRYGLVVWSKELMKSNPVFVNIIPLTTKGSPGLDVFPIQPSCYDTIDSEFNPKRSSLALCPLYQPIRTDCILQRAGVLKTEFYFSIRKMLVEKVVGLWAYNLEI
jgi:hypothetical protein